MNILSRWAANRILSRMAGPRDGRGGRRIRLDSFGIDVLDSACRERIEDILGAFFGGMESAVQSPRSRARGDGPPSPLLQPFYFEGTALGAGMRSLMALRRWSSAAPAYERTMIPPDDPFIFMRYVGMGFWAGFLYRGKVERLEELAGTLACRSHRHLLHDGYGFQTGFFRLRRDPEAFTSLRRLAGFGRASAFNGLGRSLWFFYMDRPYEGFQRARSFEEDSEAVLGGMGLAAVFTWPDQLQRAYEAAASLEGVERSHFEKGMRIALYVRQRTGEKYLREQITALPEPVRGRAEGDLEHALRVGEETRESEQFIQRFHAGCLIS